MILSFTSVDKANFSAAKVCFNRPSKSSEGEFLSDSRAEKVSNLDSRLDFSFELRSAADLPWDLPLDPNRPISPMLSSWELQLENFWKKNGSSWDHSSLEKNLSEKFEYEINARNLRAVIRCRLIYLKSLD